MSVRKHYMTLCVYNNTEITHIEKNGRLEVTFEQAVSGGFKTVVFSDDGLVLENTGFNNSEVAIFSDFLRRNINVMWQEARNLI